jgi:hypothetical protein
MIKTKTPAPIDLILETSSALFICGAAFAVISLFIRGIHDLTGLVVATSLPAAASLLLLIAALLAPGIYAVRRLAFPLNVTLPLIHGSMIFMLAELTKGSFGMEQPPSKLMPALAWDSLPFLALSVAFQIVLLSLLAAMKGPVQPSENTLEPER